MFDKKSDYALNKRVKDAIVYISAAGVPVLLTRADFANDEEFQLWKAWSDGDYQDTERSGRSFYDSYIPLDEHLDYIGAVPSIEDELFTRLSNTERIKARMELMREIRLLLTRKQFRRLWMLHVEGMSMDAIAEAEHIQHQSVSESIAAAKKKIFVFLENNPAKRPFFL